MVKSSTTKKRSDRFLKAIQKNIEKQNLIRDANRREMENIKKTAMKESTEYLEERNKENKRKKDDWASTQGRENINKVSRPTGRLGTLKAKSYYQWMRNLKTGKATIADIDRELARNETGKAGRKLQRETNRISEDTEYLAELSKENKAKKDDWVASHSQVGSDRDSRLRIARLLMAAGKNNPRRTKIFNAAVRNSARRRARTGEDNMDDLLLTTARHARGKEGRAWYKRVKTKQEMSEEMQYLEERIKENKAKKNAIYTKVDRVMARDPRQEPTFPSKKVAARSSKQWRRNWDAKKISYYDADKHHAVQMRGKAGRKRQNDVEQFHHKGHYSLLNKIGKVTEEMEFLDERNKENKAKKDAWVSSHSSVAGDRGKKQARTAVRHAGDVPSSKQRTKMRVMMYRQRRRNQQTGNETEADTQRRYVRNLTGKHGRWWQKETEKYSPVRESTQHHQYLEERNKENKAKKDAWTRSHAFGGTTTAEIQADGRRNSGVPTYPTKRQGEMHLRRYNQYLRNVKRGKIKVDEEMQYIEERNKESRAKKDAWILSRAQEGDTRAARMRDGRRQKFRDMVGKSPMPTRLQALQTLNWVRNSDHPDNDADARALDNARAARGKVGRAWYKDLKRKQNMGEEMQYIEERNKENKRKKDNYDTIRGYDVKLNTADMKRAARRKKWMPSEPVSDREREIRKKTKDLYDRAVAQGKLKYDDDYRAMLKTARGKAGRAFARDELKRIGEDMQYLDERNKENKAKKDDWMRGQSTVSGTPDKQLQSGRMENWKKGRKPRIKGYDGESDLYKRKIAQWGRNAERGKVSSDTDRIDAARAARGKFGRAWYEREKKRQGIGEDIQYLDERNKTKKTPVHNPLAEQQQFAAELRDRQSRLVTEGKKESMRRNSAMARMRNLLQ